jgi:hypothetical protein
VRGGAVGRQELDMPMYGESEVAAVGGEDARVTAVLILSIEDGIQGKSRSLAAGLSGQ